MTYERYFVKHGATTHYAFGFRSKRDANVWLNNKPKDVIEWRVGFTWKEYHSEETYQIVNRCGEEVKY